MTVTGQATVRAAGLSDVGKTRERNEDSSYVGSAVFAVADGLGGHRAGEVASGIAVAEIETTARSHNGTSADAILNAVHEANRKVFERAQNEADLRGMGTTITALSVDGGVAHLVHVGDSRCYLIRDGAISQVTNDHTLVAHMVEEGRLTTEEAESHPQRSVLTRALGAGAQVEVDTLELRLLARDRLVLCSDGLTAVISDDEIRTTAGSGDDIDAICRRLVDEANARGGPDNITVLVVDVVAAPEGGPPAVAPSAKPARSRRAPRRHRVPVRLLVWLAVVGAVAGGGVFALRSWADRSWYVGFHGDRVAIFHGLPTSILGMDLSSVEEPTSLATADVAAFFRPRLEAGIRADDLADARRIVAGIPRADQKPAPSPSPSGARSP